MKDDVLTLTRLSRFHRLAFLIALTLSFISLIILEEERSSVSEREVLAASGPVTIYEIDDGASKPMIFVAHGFAGSRQMLQYISRDLARSGFQVAAFDFYGHGRNTELLSPDVKRIEGTTRQLVRQTQEVVSELRIALGAQSGDFGLLGHSMATDIIIRAAKSWPEAKSVVAISMYSDAVTDRFPQNLLILSGQWEGRLREVGLRLVAQIDTDAVEGQTVSNDWSTRRTVSIPFTEHVAVLFNAKTMDETRRWFANTLNPATQGAPFTQGQGLAIIGLLTGIAISAYLAAALLPPRVEPQAQMGVTRFSAALVMSAVLASGAVMVAPSDVLGLSAFGSLWAFLSVCGLVQIICVWKTTVHERSFDVLGFLFLLIAGGAIFALALDRYAAAFIPVGARWILLVAFLPATVLFCVADRMMVRNAHLWRRIIARVVPVCALAVCMMDTSRNFGLLFTVIPVLCLFYFVYGLMGRTVARQCGPMTSGAALGVILAWAIAASTPLFAVS